MPYYQATKSWNFGFGLTVLPYLSLIGVLVGGIWGLSGGALGPALVFTGECSGGDWELGGIIGRCRASKFSRSRFWNSQEMSSISRYCFPSASTVYDRGCRAGCLTTRTFWYPLSVWSGTTCCEWRGRRDLACWLWYDFWCWVLAE